MIALQRIMIRFSLLFVTLFVVLFVSPKTIGFYATAKKRTHMTVTFQFALLCGGVTVAHGGYAHHLPISIHAPLWGATARLLYYELLFVHYAQFFP